MSTTPKGSSSGRCPSLNTLCWPWEQVANLISNCCRYMELDIIHAQSAEATLSPQRRGHLIQKTYLPPQGVSPGRILHLHATGGSIAL